MARDRMCLYRLEITVASGWRVTPMEWRTRAHKLYGPGYGKPSVANITRWVEAYEASMRPGGPNAHLGQDQVLTARVTNQRTGEAVAWLRSRDL